MANTRKISLKSNPQDEKPSKAETRAESTSERPTRKRMDVTGFNDKLSVRGQDPAYVYRFVKDISDELDKSTGVVDYRPGQRVAGFLAKDWEFVLSKDVQVGENSVYKTEGLGSIVRIPAGQDEWLFLMRIRKEWYAEDQKAKSQDILDTENQYAGLGSEEGTYGSVSIKHD